MRRTVLLPMLLLTSLAAQAAPDALLFCRDGRVWLLPEGQTEPRAAIAADPGWVYLQPTWLDDSRIMVMRLLGGEVSRSHVGIVNSVGPEAAEASDIEWLHAAGGAYSIGATPRHQAMAFTKIGQRGGEKFDTYLTVGPFASEWGKARRLAEYDGSPIADPRARVRFSPDGAQVVVPVFPAELSAIVELRELATNRDLDPIWLRWAWLEENGGDGAVSSVGWLGNGRILLGTLTTGLYAFNPTDRTVKPVDTWDMGRGSVTEISISADGQRAYYAVELYGEDGGESATEIRLLDENGKTSTILKDATSPDAICARG